MTPYERIQRLADDIRAMGERLRELSAAAEDAAEATAAAEGEEFTWTTHYVRPHEQETRGYIVAKDPNHTIYKNELDAIVAAADLLESGDLDTDYVGIVRLDTHIVVTATH